MRELPSKSLVPVSCRICSVWSGTWVDHRMDRPTKITFGEMRDRGGSIAPTIAAVNSVAISGDRWPDDVRLSDIEERFVCQACGKRGADVRPDFNWNGQPRGLIGRHSWIKQN